MFYVSSVLLAFVLAFAYRFRGGGFISTGSDLLVRAVWGLCLSLTYVFLSGHSVNLWYAGGIIPLAYVSLAFIPHGFCMNMGSGAHPWNLQGKTFIQGYWPGGWLPYDFTQAEYDSFSHLYKMFLDAMGMFSVGIVRGILLFAPLAWWNAHTGNIHGAVMAGLAILTKGVGSAVAYLIGDHFPFSIGQSLTAHAPNNNNTDWGEWFEGMAWLVAFIVLVS